MTIEERVPDEWLDKTHDELLEMDEVDDDEFAAEDEFRDEVGDMHALFELYGAAVMFGRMFEDNVITLGEYLDLTQHLEEYERDIDATLL
jgi:hypothetical protein